MPAPPADPRALVLPETVTVEATSLPTLAATVATAVRRAAGRRVGATDLADIEQAVGATARAAFLRRMITPDGHRVARIPLRGGRYLDVVVQARMSGGRTVVGARTVELRSIDRQEATFGHATTDGRTLPLTRGIGAGTTAGATTGAQSGHTATDSAGTRIETSLFVEGAAVTVEAAVDVTVTVTVGRLRRDGTLRARRTVIVRDDGTAHLTMAAADLAAASRPGCWASRRSPLRPARRVLRVAVADLAMAAAGSPRPHRAMADALDAMTGTRDVVLTARAAAGREQAVLTHVLLLARAFGRPVTVELTDHTGAVATLRVPPDGGLHGAPDSGYGAIAALPPTCWGRARPCRLPCAGPEQRERQEAASAARNVRTVITAALGTDRAPA